MTTGLWIIVGLAVAVGPIACSAVICAPKWWRQEIEPWWEERKRSQEPGGVLDSVFHGFESVGRAVEDRTLVWVKKVFFVLPFAMLLVVSSPVWLVIAWVDAWRAIISLGCPYTSAVEESILVDFFSEGFDELKKDWADLSRNKATVEARMDR